MNFEKNKLTDARAMQVASIVGAIGLALFVVAVAGTMEWPRVLLLSFAIFVLWASTMLAPMVYQLESARRGQVKDPWWLPPTLRPTPRRLAEARHFARQTLGKQWPAANRIAGWLHPDHASTLCQLARVCPDGPIVEIGSFRGKSTVFLANGMKPTNTLTAIDPHVMSEAGKQISWKKRVDSLNGEAERQNINTSWEAFNQTLRAWDIADKVKVIKGYSHEFRPEWKDKIAFLWIDGDHRYDAVKKDIEDWVDLVMPGGFLAFHDTHPRQGKPERGNVRSAIMDTGVLTKRGFESYLELRNAWFMQKRS